AIEDGKTAVTTLRRMPAITNDGFADEAEFQSDIAISQLRLGMYLQANGHYDEAEQALNEGLSLAEQLASDHVTRPRYREIAARTRGELGMSCLATGKLPEAVAACRAATSRLEAFVFESPLVPDHQEGFACALHGLARCLVASGEKDEATKY